MNPTVTLLSLVLSVGLLPNAAASDTLISCSLDDERSQSFCKADLRFALACKRAFRFDSSKQAIAEVNSGRVLPDFVVDGWDETGITTHRELAPAGSVQEIIRTRFDRLNGRFIEFSEYVSTATRQPLSIADLQAFEEARMKEVGAFGRLARTVISGECKVAKPGF